jgi:hypothetical protein
MVSSIDVANYALQNLGANSITSFTEGTVEATQMNLRYDSVRRSVLEMHPWNFAVKRAALSLDSVAPAFGYDNQFVLPSDCLRVFATEEQTDYINFGSNFNGYLTISNRSSFSAADDYKVEINASGKRVLLSNDDAKKIIYQFDQDDVQKFSPMFVELLAAGLASATAYRITDNATLADAARNQFYDLMRRSKTVDAQEGTYERTEQSIFLGVRQ